MYGMFSYAELFDQDISDWDVSNTTDMSGMFRSNDFFNQNISSWNVENVLNYGGFYDDAVLEINNVPPKFR
jgi:surface protein